MPSTQAHSAGDAEQQAIPLTCRIGAEVRRVDALRPIASSVAARLRDLLNTWKVLFFRDRPLAMEEHRRFASTFGPVIDDYGAANDPDHGTAQMIRSTYGNVNTLNDYALGTPTTLHRILVAGDEVAYR